MRFLFEPWTHENALHELGSRITLPKVPLGPGIHLGGNGMSVLLQGVLGLGGYLISFILIGHCGTEVL